MRISACLVFLLLLVSSARSQELFLAPANPRIETFLDQLSSEHQIELNSVAKPWSRSFIAGKLAEADNKGQLTDKQRKRIRFYSANYQMENRLDKGPATLVSLNPVSFRFRLLKGDNQIPFLKIGVVPVLEQQYGSNQVNRTEFGAAVYGYLGKHMGFSFRILKGFQSEELATPAMITMEKGQKYQAYSTGGAGYHEWTGQWTVSWNWGSLGIIKDRLEWGTSYHGSTIFSNKPPSFPFVQLRVKPAKWIEFRYIHGMMRSNLIDSMRTAENGSNGTIYRQKYIVANLLTVTPWKYLNLTFGNSTIYGDKVQAAYFIPLLFYKSLDNELYQNVGGTGGQNAQMFFDISSRQIKHLHLFLTLFVDEFKMSRVWTAEEYNFLGWKGGFRLWDLPVENLSITVEATRTLPFVYQHNVPVTNYESNDYNLGNYLRDNAQEIFCALTWSPSHYLTATLSFMYAERGDDYRYEDEKNPTRLPVLKNLTWTKQAIGAKIESEIASNLLLFLSGEYSNITGLPQYTPVSWRGKTGFVSVGIQMGL